VADVDRTLAEALQVMSDWLAYLEDKRREYRAQLERARAAAGGGNGAGPQTEAAPAESATVPEAWLSWDGTEEPPQDEWEVWARTMTEEAAPDEDPVDAGQEPTAAADPADEPSAWDAMPDEEEEATEGVSDAGAWELDEASTTPDEPTEAATPKPDLDAWV